MIHEEQSPLANKTVTLKTESPDWNIGEQFLVEDWWDRVSGGTSWMNGVGNPACLKYAIKNGFEGLPMDNEVLYGKIGPFGHLVHVSEISEEVDD